LLQPWITSSVDANADSRVFPATASHVHSFNFDVPPIIYALVLTCQAYAPVSPDIASPHVSVCAYMHTREDWLRKKCGTAMVISPE
jgi:hypothetical protein